MKKKTKKSKKNSVQELMGVRRFTQYGLQTDAGELVFFRVAPNNISVLSHENIELKIRHLQGLLSMHPDMELVCTDSCECFDANREYLRDQSAREGNPKIRTLLGKDREMLTRMQSEMSNAREFYLVMRFRELKPEMVFTAVNEAQKRMAEKGFETRRLNKAGLKRFLAIYLDASMDGDKLPDVDGAQYVEGKSTARRKKNG